MIAPVKIYVNSAPVAVKVVGARGPAGTGGSAVRQIKSTSFTAAVDGMYTTIGTLAVTDPTGTATGQTFSVKHVSGVLTLGGETYLLSQNPMLKTPELDLIRYYNGTIWETMRSYGHASTHATGGIDVITPASIGAATAAHTQAVTAGGTGLTTVAGGSALVANAADTVSTVTWHSAGTKVLTNTSGTITWADFPAGGAHDGVTLNATLTDILSLSAQELTADSAGADKLVFWDHSAGKQTYLTVGTGLTITGTTITSTGGGTPTAITVADEHADTDSFIAFFTAATGDLGPKTVSTLTFNSHTGNLGSTLFNGLTITANGTNTLNIAAGQTLTVTTGGTLASGAYAVAYVHPNHSGDVTSTADGATAIAANAVTLAKLATQAANTVLANATTGAAVPTAVTVAEQTLVGRIIGGNVDDLSVSIVRTLLNVADGATANAGTVTSVSGSAPIASTGGATPAISISASSTSSAGSAPQATAPAAGLRSVLAIDNGETARSDKALFDATNPAALGTAGAGSAMTAARRDHVHAAPAIAAITDATTVGQNLVKLTNPGAVTFPRFNADNTVTAQSAADHLTAVGALPLAGGTMTGTILLGENAPIELDAALNAVKKFSGIVESGLIGYDHPEFGELVYLAPADGRWEKTDADAAGTAALVKLGIVVSDTNTVHDGDAVKILLSGKVKKDTTAYDLTVGAPAYVSGTAGEVTKTAITTGTGKISRQIGDGNTTTELNFWPFYPSIELS
jgi:hypothetical protein